MSKKADHGAHAQRIKDLLAKHGVVYPPCGFAVGPGWLPIVDGLMTDLIALGWDRDCAQVKEKFGLLRFYIGGSTAREFGQTDLRERMHDRIGIAEELSGRTCESCGAEGRAWRTGGWLHTACEACEAAARASERR